MITKSAAEAPSRIGKRESGFEAGGRRRKRRDWLWNFGTLQRLEVSIAHDAVNVRVYLLD